MNDLMYRIRYWVIKHPLLFMISFFAFYMTWFTLLEKFRTPVVMVHSPLDDRIPFCQYFVVPYLLWFLFVFGTFLFFLIKSREDLMNICRYEFTGLIICLLIYTFIPTGLDLRGAVTGTDVFSDICRIIYSSDTPTNVCPSIHVFASLAVTTVIVRSHAFKHAKTIKTGAVILCILICLSTVFLKQHSVIDVFCGCLLAFSLRHLSYRSFFEPAYSRRRVRRV